MTFPLHCENRSVPTAPGSRKASHTPAEAAQIIGDVLTRLDELGAANLFFPLSCDAEIDDDPVLGPTLGPYGPRVLLTADLVILPPSRRFSGERDVAPNWIFALKPNQDGIDGFALAPSEFRDELAVWSYSESGLLTEGEWGSITDWLVEMLASLGSVQIGDDADPSTMAIRLSESAIALWNATEYDLPSSPRPRPDWTRHLFHENSVEKWLGERKAGRPEGVWTLWRNGVVVREETYLQGRRHGPITWWHQEVDFLGDPTNAAAAGSDDDEFAYRQGSPSRRGCFVDGAAHGHFEFFDERGRLLQEGNYEHGWPEGRWVVYPIAPRGVVGESVVDYRAGVPVSWSIAPLAFHCVALHSDDNPPVTLAELSAGHRGVVLVDCAESTDLEISERVAGELATLEEILIVGVHPTMPGSGRLGERGFPILADASGDLIRAYGNPDGALMPLTYFGEDGTRRGGSTLRHARLAAVFRADPRRQ